MRAELNTNATVWVGQKVALVVELLAPGYFASAATFDLPDPQGVLLLPPMEHPLVSGKTITDTYYTVQRHELLAYAMRSGDQTIPAFKARFNFKRSPLDTNELAATVTTVPIPFKVQQPPGAEHLGQIISARELRLDETWRPEPGKTNVRAGSAFTRTVTFRAPDVPGMVFPPFPAGRIDGLGIYAKRQVSDQTERGTMRGERSDIITYICQRPGEFTIPSVRFIWFDLGTKQLNTNDLPARTLNVIANPALSTAGGAGVAQGAAGRFGPWRWFAGAMALVLLVLLAGWNAGFRRVMAKLFMPLRPLHLKTLNPTEY